MSTTTAPVVPWHADFPRELVGKKILLATESLGPVNGVSRTTQSLVDYLRSNGVNVATCAPTYKGQPIVASSTPSSTSSSIELTKSTRQPILNKDWIRSIEAKSSSLASRGIGGAWLWHHEKSEGSEKEPLLQASSATPSPPLFNRTRSEDHRRRNAASVSTTSNLNPEFRLQGFPLPYNPDLSIAYPFRLGRIYQQTFGDSAPDLIYLASPASVGFQFLIQLRSLPSGTCPPICLNFQTDLAAYASIILSPPLDAYGVWLLQKVQGYLFSAPAIRTIFYPSAYVAKYMSSAGAPAEKMLQLGRGVDTTLFNPDKFDRSYRRTIASDEEIIFVCISRLAPEKGFEFLASAATRLLTTAPDLKWKLLIVGGNTSPSVDASIRSLFSTSDLAPRVHFTGMLRGTFLARAYAVADVFLHCSITETFGLVVLESMASGVPVIARDEGGPSETVKHGDSGYLVDPLDMETFVARAQELAVNVNRRKSMALAARRQAEGLTWDAINCKVAHKLVEALRSAGRLSSPDNDDEKVGRERRDSGVSGLVGPNKPKPARRKAEMGMVQAAYGGWWGLVKVYCAVGIVWVFWCIAVFPLIAAGLVHGLVH
ncbi:unnamed protein product [Zymoseptoria tritici ST99CH_3D7]|uniref:Glycosyl transferase family 1 domain-containing protein n=1 Tax=Zymoseptoria tritici (strain ST99CH_3D7) TaxID=1276538 RepID=A0A1X7S237_ZYMT9|nr:unnamed protein product [Zymoseptoria tritici ST99CH_3D7]